MLVKAEGRFLRISPTKVRQTIDLIRDKGVLEAQGILTLLNKRPKEYLIKLLKQAIANAKVKGFNQEQLYISKIICNSGPIWKRFKAAAFGRATPIKKRTAHIRIELDLITQDTLQPKAGTPSKPRLKVSPKVSPRKKQVRR